MTWLIRPLVPVAILGAVLIAGCSSSSSSVAGASSAAPSGSISATMAPGSVVPASASAAPVSPAAGPGMTTPATSGGVNQAVFFAQSGDIRGTVEFRPGCATGCPLSGDGTTQLWHMTWPTWNAAEAVGSGTEKIDGCNPDCAAGPLYSVRVTVTFSEPAEVCAGGNDQWFWTRAAFTWPNGLPAAVSGANAPVNPVNWSQITSQPCG